MSGERNWRRVVGTGGEESGITGWGPWGEEELPLVTGIEALNIETRFAKNYSVGHVEGGVAMFCRKRFCKTKGASVKGEELGRSCKQWGGVARDYRVGYVEGGVVMDYALRGRGGCT